MGTNAGRRRGAPEHGPRSVGDPLQNRSLRGIEHVCVSKRLFFSDDFGKDAKKNKINAGVFFVQINKESVTYLEKVWNEYHGMSLFYRPPREEQAAMRRFLERDAVEFEKYAVIVPHRVFNNYHKTAEQDDFLRHYTRVTVRGEARQRVKASTTRYWRKSRGTHHLATYHSRGKECARRIHTLRTHEFSREDSSHGISDANADGRDE